MTVLIAEPAAFTAVADSGVRPLHVTGGGFGAGAAAFLGQQATRSSRCTSSATR